MRAETPQLEVRPDAEPLPPTALDRLLWPLMLLLAWLAFELTANATLSLVLACLKFGMNDFRTAWWLWRTDPRRPRARACASFYAASGVWKTAVVPLLITVTVAIVWVMVAPQALRKAHPVAAQLVLSLQVGSCAAAILILLSSAATAFAWTARWRVWVHPQLHRCRKAGHWPPRFAPTDQRPTNYAFLIILTAVFAIVVTGPVVTLFTVRVLLQPPAAIGRIVALLVVFGYPIGGGLVFTLLRGRLFAASPWECWPESLRNLAAGST